MPTAQTLITSAAKRLMLDAGEGLNASELADCLEGLNQIIGSWNTQEKMATAATQATQALTTAQTYVLATRYPKVVAATHTQPNGMTMPVEVVNTKSWSEIEDRDIAGNWVKKLFYDRGATTGTIYLSPKPAITGGTMTMQVWAAQATFALLSTNNTLLPGYELALVCCLAVEVMAPLFEVQPNEMLVVSYKNAMDEIAKLNMELWGTLPAAA